MPCCLAERAVVALLFWVLHNAVGVFSAKSILKHGYQPFFSIVIAHCARRYNAND
jgi:hypothetical protein